MSAAKHTPGPWVATPNLTAVVADGGEAGNRMITSTLGKRFMPILEQQANTRLIAAAPDLLAALDLACATVELFTREGAQTQQAWPRDSADNIDYRAVAKRCRSVIARATGEPT